MQDEYESQSEFNKVTQFGKNADGNPMMLIREELSNGWNIYQLTL